MTIMDNYVEPTVSRDTGRQPPNPAQDESGPFTGQRAEAAGVASSSSPAALSNGIKDIKDRVVVSPPSATSKGIALQPVQTSHAVTTQTLSRPPNGHLSHNNQHLHHPPSLNASLTNGIPYSALAHSYPQAFQHQVAGQLPTGSSLPQQYPPVYSMQFPQHPHVAAAAAAMQQHPFNQYQYQAQAMQYSAQQLPPQIPQVPQQPQTSYPLQQHSQHSAIVGQPPGGGPANPYAFPVYMPQAVGPAAFAPVPSSADESFRNTNTTGARPASASGLSMSSMQTQPQHMWPRLAYHHPPPPQQQQQQQHPSNMGGQTGGVPYFSYTFQQPQLPTGTVRPSAAGSDQVPQDPHGNQHGAGRQVAGSSDTRAASSKPSTPQRNADVDASELGEMLAQASHDTMIETIRDIMAEADAVKSRFNMTNNDMAALVGGCKGEHYANMRLAAIRGTFNGGPVARQFYVRVANAVRPRTEQNDRQLAARCQELVAMRRDRASNRKVKSGEPAKRSVSEVHASSASSNAKSAKRSSSGPPSIASPRPFQHRPESSRSSDLSSPGSCQAAASRSEDDPQRPKRTKIVGEPRKILESFWDNNGHHPTASEKQAMSASTGLAVKTITTWFQNKRQRDPSNASSRNTPTTPGSSSTDRETPTASRQSQRQHQQQQQPHRSSDSPVLKPKANGQPHTSSLDALAKVAADEELRIIASEASSSGTVSPDSEVAQTKAH